MGINVLKLHKELESAGIPITGCNSKGVIFFKPEATQGQKNTAAQILSAHNPDWYIDNRVKEYPPIAEQLDMIWKDKKDGTNKWFELIQNIKNKYPQQ